MPCTMSDRTLGSQQTSCVRCPSADDFGCGFHCALSLGTRSISRRLVSNSASTSFRNSWPMVIVPFRDERDGRARGSIEQIVEERLPLVVLPVPLLPVDGILVGVVLPERPVETWRGLRRARRPSRELGSGALEDLVELPAVEPHAAALRTVVDLEAATLAHHEVDAAGRAEQTGGLL